MCDFCKCSDDDKKAPTFLLEKSVHKFDTFVSIDYDGILTSITFFGNEEIISTRRSIFFCPMCGRKLPKEEET